MKENFTLTDDTTISELLKFIRDNNIECEYYLVASLNAHNEQCNNLSISNYNSLALKDEFNKLIQNIKKRKSRYSH